MGLGLSLIYGLISYSLSSLLVFLLMILRLLQFRWNVAWFLASAGTLLFITGVLFCSKLSLISYHCTPSYYIAHVQIIVCPVLLMYMINNFTKVITYKACHCINQLHIRLSAFAFCVCVVVYRGKILGERYVEETQNKEKGYRYLLEMVHTHTVH